MSQSIQAALQQIDSGNILPVYLLQGEDQFLQQFVVQKIESVFFTDAPIDKTYLLPDEMGGNEILDRINATDLFNSKKLFILRDPQRIRSNHRNEFLDYCSNPIATNCLVIMLEEYRESVAIVKQLTKRIDQISVRTPYTSELRKWTNYFLKEYEVESTSGAIDSIIDIAGDSIQHISNEVQKMKLMLADGEKLTNEIITQFSGWKREHQRWEFLLALGNRDIDEALKMGMSLIRQGDSLLSLLYPITSLFQEMLFSKLKSGTFSDRTGYIPLPGSVTRRLPSFVKKYSEQEIVKSLSNLGKLDARIKSTSYKDETELIQLLFKIITDQDG